MNSAAFLLAINFSIGLAFATAFLALTRRSAIPIGRWCAFGFLCASATVTVEALASVIPSVRLTSALSFALLMLAMTTIAAGIARQYRPTAPLAPFATLFTICVAFNTLVVFERPRGSWFQALGYQLPFTLMLAIAASLTIAASPRRPVDLILAGILGLSGLHFTTKAILAGLAGSGPGVRDYIVSTYAFYSQTAGGILSLLLGLALVGLVVTEVMEEAKLRLQRDGLSGVLNRNAFMERAPDALRRSGSTTPATLILADLDRFKSINDRFGHAAGDEVIQAFGADLRTQFGNGALCGRMGGEEFCILIPDCGPATARLHLDALRGLSEQRRYELVPDAVTVTASFGVAITDAREPFDHALRRADMALYDAKASGRDGYRFAAASAAPASERRSAQPRSNTSRALHDGADA